MNIVIDTDANADLPGYPPNSCPDCGRSFNKRPRRQLTYVAWLMITVGICLSLVWAVTVWFTAADLARALGIVVIPWNIITGAIYLVIAAAPAYMLALAANWLPKSVQRNCRQCGWRKRYWVNGRGRLIGHHRNY